LANTGQQAPPASNQTQSSFNPDQLGSSPCKHSSAAVSEENLANRNLASTKAESTPALAKPVADPETAGSLAVQEGAGVEPFRAIATATQRYSTASKRATAIAQAAAAKRKSPSRSTVKPGSVATLNAKAAPFSPSASHHRAAAPLDSIPEAEERATKT